MECYEVFLSYHHADVAVAKPLYHALIGQGLEVFFDEVELSSHESITRRLDNGLARSKVLLAVYSKTYPTRRACQFELTAAFLAAQRAGDPRDRVLVVNPDEGVEQIEPIQLRDAVFEKLHETDTPECFEQLARKIKRKVKGTEGVLGDSRLLASVSWYARHPVSSPGFVGRFPAMWEIHSSLHASDLRPITGAAGPAVAQLVGIGGQGKTMLAEEYALRFVSAYPGGVFWLTVSADEANSQATRAADRKQQIEVLATSLGAPIAGLTKEGDVKAALCQELERCGETHLWVIDDVPDDMQADELRAWFAPHRLGKTMLITRSHTYDELARKIELKELSPQEAGELLTRHRTPEGESELEEAALLAEDLAHHALALKVAGAALKYEAGLEPYADFRRALENPSKDELELAAELTSTLATGHDPSIAKTLLSSVVRVGADATDVLRLACQLANTPIPSSFIDRVLSAVDDYDQIEARERGMRARKDLVEASLSGLVENGKAISVHPLVARTMRFAERNSPDRQQQLRGSATAVLAEALDPGRVAGISSEVESLIPHARQLVATATTSAEILLAECLASYDFGRGAFSSARELQERVLKDRRETLGERHPDTLAAISNLASTLRALGDLRRARELQERVLEDRRETLGERHPDTLAAISNLALTLAALGDLRRARELQERVLEDRRETLGEYHPDTLAAMNALALTLSQLGDLKRARELHERVLMDRRETLGERHPDTLVTMANLALTLHMLGDLKRARELHERVLEDRRETLGERHPSTLNATNNLALTLSQLGELQKARELQMQALDGLQELHGEHHTNTLITMNNLASTLAALGELEQARKLLEQVFDGLQKLLGERHPDTLQAMQNLASALAALGEPEQARELLEQLKKRTTEDW